MVLDEDVLALGGQVSLCVTAILVTSYALLTGYPPHLMLMIATMLAMLITVPGVVAGHIASSEKRVLRKLWFDTLTDRFAFDQYREESNVDWRAAAIQAKDDILAGDTAAFFPGTHRVVSFGIFIAAVALHVGLILLVPFLSWWLAKGAHYWAPDLVRLINKPLL